MEVYMCKKIISHLLILSILLTGCYSWELVQEPEANSTIRVTTKDNEVYQMSEWEDKNEQIIGDAGEIKREGRFTQELITKINKKDITKYEVRYVDGSKTLIVLGGLILVGAIVTYATWDGPNAGLK
jgi:hypothetical protein